MNGDQDQFNVDPEAWRQQFWGNDAGGPGPKSNGADKDAGWGEPYMGVLELRRRRPTPFPTGLFGEQWGSWVSGAALAAACPVDYVGMPLITSASALIGNARWPQATPGWAEPPHLWGGSVGYSGDGKTPGANCLLREVLPEIERRMLGDFPDRLLDWELAIEADKIARNSWLKALRDDPNAPHPVPTADPNRPMRPRLRQYDVTVEQVAMVLAHAAPKGVLIVRDELAGWLTGMDIYNTSGRQFWLEAYNGGFYRVERRKHETTPIDVERLVVGVYGGIQPSRLAELFAAPDDGLFSRFLWAWPDPLPFRLGTEAPRTAWAIEALDRLRLLELHQGNPAYPIHVALERSALPQLEAFALEIEDRKSFAGGLMRSAYGKARGLALRLSLVLEYLWWSGKEGFDPPPEMISTEAFTAAAAMVSDYFIPAAERVYGDAAATEEEGNAATLARWIQNAKPSEVHVRDLQRRARLPGLRQAAQIKKAAGILIEADWLRAPNIGFGPQSKVVYLVNPKVWGE